MRAVRLVLLLGLVPACTPNVHAPLPPAPAPTPAEPSFRVVKLLAESFHEDGGFGTRDWDVVSTSPPLLHSRRDFVDARSGEIVWSWKGELMRTVPRPTGHAREIAFITSENESFLASSELVVADVALGREVARYPLGVARELWLSERGVAVRATPEKPLQFTAWDGRAITLPWTGDVAGVEATADTVTIRTRFHGRVEHQSFDAHSGAPRSDVTRSDPNRVEIEQTSDRWRLVRGGVVSSFTSQWASARIVRASSEEVLVSALQCVDRGDRLRGRILVFDRDLKLRRAISVPPRDYHLVERTPTTLRLLGGRYESGCPEAFTMRSHTPEAIPALLEIEQP